MRLAICLLTMVIAGCGLLPPAPIAAVPTTSLFEARVSQLGFGADARYSYCVDDCPAPTPKTPIVRRPPAPQVESRTPETMVLFVEFPAGSAKPVETSLAAIGDHVRRARIIRVIARADGVGSKPNNERLARRRAEGLRDALIRIGARKVDLDTEIPHVAPAQAWERRLMRRASIQLTM